MKYNGFVKQFPFEKGDGVFDISFDTRDVTLKFHKDWPAFKKVKASVRFFAKSMAVQYVQWSCFRAGVAANPDRNSHSGQECHAQV